MIHDRSCQTVVLDQNECVANGGRCGYVSACFLKRGSDVHADEHFVLNHEDRAPAQRGELHVVAPLRG
jgi:hypothetical protein